MWNPFKKSKEKQLKEIIASATLDYLKDMAEEETRNKLKNENVNDKKLYELLKSKAKIYMSEMYSPINVIGFFGDYKYDIRRTDNVEYLEFIIDGKFYIYPKIDLNNIETDVLIHIGDTFNNVVCYGKICSYLVNNGIEDGIDVSIIIRIPFKEISIPFKEINFSEINI